MFAGIFSAVLTMSVTASIAILCVLLGRLLLKRTPKIFSYVLWAVVLFRLLCPVSLPAAFSLFSLVPMPAAATGQVEHPPQTLPPENDPAAPEPLPAEGQEGPLQPAPEKGLSPAVSLRAAGAVLWLGGVGAMAVYGLVKLMRLRRKLVGAIPLEGSVFLADHIPTPFVLGVFRPRIYLPSALLPEESPYIIAHERHHIARGDHITRILAYAALCLHWFNPLVWLAFVLSGRDMEMSCDEAVMRTAGRDIRAEYSTALLQLSTDRRLTPLAFGQGDIKERIENMMRYKKPACLVTVVAVALCLTLTACLSTDPPETVSENTEGIWSEVTDANWSSKDYGSGTGIDAIPADWTLPETLDLGENPRIEVCGDLLLYGSSYETAMMDGFTVARYEAGNLTPIYTFDEGITVSWQEFFSPDGQHLVFPWKIQSNQPGGMKIRVVDLNTGVETDLEPPQWESDSDILFVKWHDDTSLQVSAMTIGGTNWAHWIYTFPASNISLTLTGYITELDPSTRTVTFDQVFWLTSPENDALLEGLGISEEELPNGYYIYNPETETHTYPISPQATQQIFETPENDAWRLVDTDLATFAKDLNTRTPLYTITVKNGEATQLAERYVP